MTAMWNHYCPIEKTDMKIGNGEPCNWCGLESGPIQRCSGQDCHGSTDCSSGADIVLSYLAAD